MFTAIIQADDCQEAVTGKPIPKGTVIFHATAWQLCLPAELNFLGLPPRAIPGDEETAAKVREHVAEVRPVVAAEQIVLQKRLDTLAAKYPEAINKATGDFARNNKGELPKEMDAVTVHIITLAQNRGMKPNLTATKKPAG